MRRNIRTRRPSAKLDHLKLGPFKIEEKTGPLNYRLKLPNSIRRIHATFYILLLEKAPRNAEIATNIEIEEETENEYEVEEILAMNKVSGKPHYLVKWKNYGTSENTWEPMEHLTNSRQKLRQYWKNRRADPRRGNPRRGQERPSPRH